MGEVYPNLMFYRGCEFGLPSRSLGEFSGYEGFDFALGSLETAIRHAKEGFVSTKRDKSVIVMMSFADVGEAYALHNLRLGAEEKWWRNSLEIHIGNKEKRKLMSEGKLIMRRPPSDEVAKARIIQSYQQKTIPLRK